MRVFSGINSFGAKLTLLLTATSGVAVGLVCAILLLIHYLEMRHDAAETVETQARIIAANSSAAIAFENAADARETLESLETVPEIAAAFIFKTDGTVFAEYKRDRAKAMPQVSADSPEEITDHWMVRKHSIDMDGQTLGALVLVSDLTSLYQRLALDGTVAILVSLGAMACGFLMASRLKQIVATPVSELVKTAEHVSHTRDYNVRARRFSDDELGQFTDVFNEMLVQIDRQNTSIAAAGDRFRTVIESAPNAMIMVDESGRIVLVNRQAERYFGYTRDELLSMLLEELVPARYRARHPEYRREYFADPSARPMGAGRELFGLRKDGTEFPVEIGLNPIVTDEGPRVLSTIVDITERRRAQEALRESDERLRVALTAAEMGTWRIDLRTGVETRDPMLNKMLGQQAVETTNQFSEMLPWLHADDVARVKQSLDSAIQTHGPFEEEFRIVRADGSVRWLRSRGRYVDASGGKVYITGAVVDITQRREAEEERLVLLESERAARTEAERASRMKDEFVATLSHELRTPLTAILGWAQMLRKGTPRPEDLSQALEIIERNARVQTRIIDDLLDISRIISGKIRLDVHQVRLDEVIEAALATVQPAADAKSIRIQTVLDPAAPPVRGDASRLQQVVWNLLSNAIKFTPRGGRVQVTLVRVNSHLEVIVSDTGEGMKPEFLPHIFERFRQADASASRRHGGLGLGLAIVKQLVELHGGTVHATSSGEGQGATFTLKLPLAIVHEPEIVEPRFHPRIPKALALDDRTITLKGVRVLVVDDEPDARHLVARVLESNEAEVVLCASGYEAEHAINDQLPDVIVSDIGMPGQDGYEFMRHVRSRAPDKGGAIPAIALTAFARSEDRTRALLSGYQMHLAKPVEPSELLATVAAVAGVTSRLHSRSGNGGTNRNAGPPDSDSFHQ